jgi:hypothetical protein
MSTFDRSKLPGDLTVDIIDTTNAAIDRLRARKIASLHSDSTSAIGWFKNWAHLYLQAHIRRSLSFIDGGVAELAAGRTIVTALCARSLLEDAAVIWQFVERLTALLDQGDEDQIEKFLFSRALATRDPSKIEELGKDHAATNILTYIDNMVPLNTGYRDAYDDLSEVVHPNSLGVLFHFTNFNQDGVAIF